MWKYVQLTFQGISFESFKNEVILHVYFCVRAYSLNMLLLLLHWYSSKAWCLKFKKMPYYEDVPKYIESLHLQKAI